MSACRVCGRTYRPGNWKWSAWICNACVKAGKTPDDIPAGR